MYLSFEESLVKLNKHASISFTTGSHVMNVTQFFIRISPTVGKALVILS